MGCLEQGNDEQSDARKNAESLRKLAEALGQKPDTQEAFGDQCRYTQAARNAAKYAPTQTPHGEAGTSRIDYNHRPVPNPSGGDNGIHGAPGGGTINWTPSSTGERNTEQWAIKAEALFKSLSAGGNVSKIDLKLALTLHNPNVDLKVPKTTCAKLWIDTANLKTNTAQTVVIINSNDLRRRLG